ncbi:MAG: tudor domain-containing protein [Candidatus Curtissbacteria bacterium]|nr:tudor domain-containing protein [Candidatus Curtissbacteria bacterium]
MKKFITLGVLSAFLLVACASAFKTGDTVWAEWTPDSWWHATVDESCDKDGKKGWHVNFDDGDEGCYVAGEILHDVAPTANLAVGAQVIAYWTDTHFYAGEIMEVTEEGYRVKWTDGSERVVAFDQVVAK